jgi:hypothetical protein
MKNSIMTEKLVRRGHHVPSEYLAHDTRSQASPDDASSEIRRHCLAQKDEALLALRDELIRLAADEPDEVSEHEDMVDFHWRSDSFAKAETVAAALAALRRRGEVVLLRLSNCDDPQSSFTFKDERHGGHEPHAIQIGKACDACILSRAGSYRR